MYLLLDSNWSLCSVPLCIQLVKFIAMSLSTFEGSCKFCMKVLKAKANISEKSKMCPKNQITCKIMTNKKTGKCWKLFKQIFYPLSNFEKHFAFSAGGSPNKNVVD